MSKNQHQKETVSAATPQTVNQAPRRSGEPGGSRIGKSPLTQPRRRIRIRYRAFRKKTYTIGMTSLNGRELAGELLSVRRASKGASNRNPTATIRCSKCGKIKDLRMDNYLRQNDTCGCGADQNLEDQIEKVIRVVGREGEDLAKALESGFLTSQCERGTYKATRAEIAQHFGLLPTKGSGGADRIRNSAAKALGHTARFVPFAIARIQRRWAVSTWKRLGEPKVRRIAEAVRDFGLKWTARNICGGCTATAHVCMRWVLQGFPRIDTLCCA